MVCYYRIINCRFMKQQSGLHHTKELPYTPIQFTYSQTIGAKNSKAQSASIYSHEYKDILIPRILSHHNPVFYLLFHTPTVYNWLRTIKCNESRLLDSYIRTGATSQSKKNAGKQDQIALNLLKSSLSDYVKKWEAVKLAFCHKVYIKRQVSGGEICTHLCKTQVYTHEIDYNPKTKSFAYPLIFCKQCQTQHTFQCQTREFSHYIFLSHRSQAVITLQKQKITYNLYFLISENQIFIKSANKIWYEIDIKLQTSKAIGFSQINLKTIKFSAYAQKLEQSPSLKIAQPILNLQQEKRELLDNQKMEVQADEKLNEFKTKNVETNSVKTSQQKQKKSLKELKMKPNQVLLRDPSKDYIQSVSKLYIEPKVKDQYELGYDKGKLKKKKQKKIFIKPDFNQIHQQLKTVGVPVNQPEKMDKKIKKKFRKERKDKSLNFDDNEQ